MRSLTFLSLSLSFMLSSTAAFASSSTIDGAVDELLAALNTRLSSGDLVSVGGIDEAVGCPSSQVTTTKLLGALEKHGIRARTKASTTEALNEAARAMNEGTASEDAPLEGSQTRLEVALEREDSACRVTISAYDIASAQFLGRGQAHLGATEASTANAQSLDVALRRLSDQLVSNLSKLGGDKRYQRFGVLSFDEVGESTKEKQLGKLVSAELQTWLRRDHNLLLVEREQLGRLIEEIQLGQTGLVNEEQAVEVGQMSGAEALILGSVLEAGDRYVVNAKLVSTSSGQVVAAERTELPAADLVALSADAVVLRSRSGAVFRSLLVPGWGQFYNREPIKGSLFGTAELITGGLATTFHVLQDKNQREYEALNGDSALESFEAKRNTIERQQKFRQTFLTAALVLHAINVIDAFLTAESFESAQPSFSSDGFSLSYQW
tara:strand:+ start:282 stop:1592 length:1311 start_codon:yes stop_codon:yes gene_type:complete